MIKSKWKAAGLSLILIIPGLAQEKEEIEVPPEVQAIEPYSEDAGDFLDTDFTIYTRGAYQAYESKKYELAAKFYLAYLEHNCDQPGAIYNLACCYGLLGREKLAAEYLMRSFTAGFKDLEHIMRDPDFKKVRKSDAFKIVLDSITAVAEKEEARKGTVSLVAGSLILPSHIKVPRDYDPEHRYDLLVGLHGFGANPGDFIKVWERFGENPEFIYVAPQAPYCLDIGGEIGFSWEKRTQDEAEYRTSRAMSEEYVLNVIEEMKTQYSIDKVYLMGFSQGGGYTYCIGLKNPEVFAGIMPLGGWLDEEWISEETLKAGSEVPVFIGHGKDDRSVDYKAAKRANKTLTKLGYEVTFFSFDGGHAVPEEECKALVEWMESQR